MQRNSFDLDPALDDIEWPHSNTVARYKQVIGEYMTNGLAKEAKPQMSFFVAVKDGIYQERKFSLKKLVKVLAALGVGVAASVFALAPSAKAPVTIAEIIKRLSGHDLGSMLIPSVFAQTVGFTSGAVMSLNTALRMIDAYFFAEISSEERHLILHQATCSEKFQQIGRGTFNALSALAASIPMFLLTMGTRQAHEYVLATLTAMANTSVSWVGVAALSLSPNRVHPARKIEIQYLTRQIEEFIKLDVEAQSAIITRLKAGAVTDIEARQRDFLCQLYSLASLSLQERGQQRQVLEKNEPRWLETNVPRMLAILCAAYNIIFIETGAVGVARLFPDPVSASAMIAGVVVALFMFIPYMGFGFLGGMKTGEAMVSPRVPLSALYEPEWRRGTQFLLYFIAFLSRGTVFTLGASMMKDLAGAARWSQSVEDILSLVVGSIVSLASMLAVSYYLCSLLDDTLMFFAARCGDKHRKEVINFVEYAQKLIDLHGKMSEENYREVLAWKLAPDPVTGRRDRLAKQLAAVLKEYLSPAEYVGLQKQLNTKQIVLADASKDKHLAPRFFTSAPKNRAEQRAREKIQTTESSTLGIAL